MRRSKVRGLGVRRRKVRGLGVRMKKVRGLGVRRKKVRGLGVRRKKGPCACAACTLGLYIVSQLLHLIASQ